MNITESSSHYHNLEKMTVVEILQNMNAEDKKVPLAVEKAIPQIEKLVSAIVEKMASGGRVFYIGAGTSGRLGIVDASECPPSFGVSNDLFIGLIAGGDTAIRTAVEFAEDDKESAWANLSRHNISSKDIVIGIAASGSTPYVIGGLKKCQSAGINTGCITCNPDSQIAALSDFPVEVIVGPEFVTGSTRLKAGTAQKLVLNMISTSVMIKMGRIKGNKMVDMQLTNNKLISRGAKILMQELNIGQAEADNLLKAHKNVRKAIDWFKNDARN